MDSIPVETLLNIFKSFEVKDLLSVSLTCKYYYDVVNDERIWRNLYLITYGTFNLHLNNVNIKNSNAKQTAAKRLQRIRRLIHGIVDLNDTTEPSNDNSLDLNRLNYFIPIKGWKNEFKRRSIKHQTSNLRNLILEKDDIKYLLDLNISMKMYIPSFDNYLIQAIGRQKTKILSQLIQFARYNGTVPISYKDALINLSSHKKESLRVILECDNAYINYNTTTGVLLMSRVPKQFLGSTYRIDVGLIYRTNLITSILAIETIVSQLTLFLCAQTGNVERLQELLLKSAAHQSTLINKPTGHWDYGNEVCYLSMASKYHLRLMKDRTEADSTLKALEVHLSQHAMIKKTMAQLAAQWNAEWSSFTPLHWAAYGSHFKTLKVLVKCGANLNAITSHGRTALDIARDVYKQHQSNQHLNPLQQQYNRQCIQYLEKQKSKQINHSDFEDLKRSIELGDSMFVVKFLNQYLFNKEDISTIVMRENLIVSDLLSHAVIHDQPNILSILYNTLHAGAFTNQEIFDHNENTPLHIACIYGRLECLKFTIERFNVNAFNNVWQTPLMLALTHRNYQLVPYLLEAGASPSLCDWRGINALTLAVDADSTIFELLLESKLVSMIKNNEDKNIMHMISQHPKGSLNNLLLLANNFFVSDELKLLFEAKDRFGHTPISLAVHSENLTILSYFLECSDLSKDVKHAAYLTAKRSKQYNQELLNCFNEFLISYESERLALNAAISASTSANTNIALPNTAISPDIDNRNRTVKLYDIYTQLSSSTIDSAQVTKLLSETVNQIKPVDLDNLLISQLTLSRYEIAREIMSVFRRYSEIKVIECLYHENETKLSEITWFIDRLALDISNQHRNLISDYIEWAIERDFHYLVQSFHNVGVQLSLLHLHKCFKISSYRCARILLESVAKESKKSPPERTEEEFHQIVSKLKKVVCKGRLDEFIQLAREHDIPEDKLKPITVSVYSAYDFLSFPTMANEQPGHGNHQFPGDDAKHNFNPDAKDASLKVCDQCQLKIRLSDVDDHNLVCLSRQCVCPNAQYGCQTGLIAREKLSDHLQRDCAYLRCPECDLHCTRSSFFDHQMSSHDSEAWIACTLCSQILRGFRKTYTDTILHLNIDYQQQQQQQLQNNHHNHNHHSNYHCSSEYRHLRSGDCRIHMIKCHSCQLSFTPKKFDNHECIYILIPLDQMF